MPSPTPFVPSRSAHRYRLWPALAVAVASGLAAVAWTLFMPNYYRSEARILSDAGQAGSVPTRAGIWAPTAGPEAAVGTRDDGPTIIYADVLKSRRMAEALLQARYDYGIRTGRFLLGDPASARVQGTLLDYLGAGSLDRGVAGLRGILGIQRDTKSGLLTISAETRSPELSLQVIRNAVRLLREFLVEISQTPGRTRAEFTQRRLDEVQAKYDQASRDYVGFQEGNRDWEQSPSATVRNRGQRLRETVELWRQVRTNLALNHEQALLDSRNDTQTLLLLDTGNLPQIKSRPARAFIVLVTMCLAGLAAWIFLNRNLVYQRFLAKEPAA